jgi:acetyltransferase-like isoleucine patch superfamily enzyme
LQLKILWLFGILELTSLYCISLGMRKISFLQILVFVFLFGVAAALAWVSAFWLGGETYIHDGISVIVAGVIFFYLYISLVYRIFMKLFPLPTGYLPQGSRGEFIYHVYILFFLVVFYPIAQSNILPMPLRRVFYRILGAKIGKNTYPNGMIFDPLFVSVGEYVSIGYQSSIIPHVIENGNIEHHPIRIGNNATIGAHAVILSGAEIGDGSIVAAGAVVRKNEKIGPGEVWGGVPAQKIRERIAGSLRKA